MTTHTPGPWYYKTYARPPFAHSGTWIYGVGGSVIAIVQTDAEATDEDARLIAKAPELLGTLRNLTESVSDLPMSNNAAVHMDIEMARALLAEIDWGGNDKGT